MIRCWFVPRHFRPVRHAHVVRHVVWRRAVRTAFVLVCAGTVAGPALSPVGPGYAPAPPVGYAPSGGGYLPAVLLLPPGGYLSPGARPLADVPNGPGPSSVASGERVFDVPEPGALLLFAWGLASLAITGVLRDRGLRRKLFAAGQSGFHHKGAL